MELEKFEKEASVKLAERELDPSGGSWDKIADSLQDAERNRNGRKWYYIAAVVAVFAIISGSFLINNETGETKIVEEPLKEEKEPSPEIQQHHKAPVEIVSEAPDPVKKENQKTTNALSEKKHVQMVLTIQAKEPIFEKIVVPESSLQLKPDFHNDIEQYISEAVKADKEKDLADAEVDQLLAEAAAKLSAKYSKQTSEKITPELLLAEVENDLDQSFRRKVFELLKDGFEEASYAFTNRKK